MKFNRRKTRQIHIGKVGIGSDFPISVQSMTTTKTKDVESTLSQIYELATKGEDIVRVTCNEVDAA